MKKIPCLSSAFVAMSLSDVGLLLFSRDKNPCCSVIVLDPGNGTSPSIEDALDKVAKSGISQKAAAVNDRLMILCLEMFLS